jgi:hypothetical protein
VAGCQLDSIDNNFQTSLVSTRSTGRTVPVGNARNSIDRPAVPPILNLGRAGATQAENYFNLVRPQIDQRNATLQQGSQLNQLRRDVEKAPGFRGSAVGRMSPTGHHAEFMNMSHFHKGGGAAAGKR